MLLLVIVAFIATTAFYSNAKRRGLHAGRAAMLPFSVLGAFLIFAHVTGMLVSMLLERVDMSTFSENSIWFAFNVSLLCAYLVFIRKNWIVLSSRPTPSDGTDDSSL